MTNKSKWDLEITPENKLQILNLQEIWRYRDLILLFVRRDFVAVYKQTIFGPLWFFIQPILTTITFTIIFGNIAKLPTDGHPAQLFYLAGITSWNYFSSCLMSTSNTFVSNAGIFGKVYFPRIAVPISQVISNLIKFSIQFLLFIGVFAYYYFNDSGVMPNYYLLLLPLLLINMAIMGLSYGMIISSLTTKYRDLSFLVGFGVQLIMYATPIIYPLSIVPEKYQWIILLNPMTAMIEFFKYGFLGGVVPSISHLFYSVLSSIIFFVVGSYIFRKVEKNFMDTV